MWQDMWQNERFSGQRTRKKIHFSKFEQKRTHQAFLLGEFVANGVNCDTRDG
jgi:hypothetical protein